jgi:hypothetical protein
VIEKFERPPVFSHQYPSHHVMITSCSSGKNSRYFHTLGYETIFLQKSNFFHTQKVLFHTLENCFIPSKKWKLFSYPYTKVSYLENFFHTLIQKFHTLSKYFSYPQKPISYPNL